MKTLRAWRSFPGQRRAVAQGLVKALANVSAESLEAARTRRGRNATATGSNGLEVAALLSQLRQYEAALADLHARLAAVEARLNQQDDVEGTAGAVAHEQ